jgi:hypothetical protein
MSDISIQFHAIPDELVPLVKELVSEPQVHFLGMGSPPFTVTEISPEQIEQAMLDRSYWRFAFTKEKPIPPIVSQKEFGERHPCALILDVGRRTNRGLEQSWLACRTFDLPLPDAWRRFARKLRAITTAGAVAVNPDTGASAIVRNHRYTPGAKELNESGVPMCSAGGTFLNLRD